MTKDRDILSENNNYLQQENKKLTKKSKEFKRIIAGFIAICVAIDRPYNKTQGKLIDELKALGVRLSDKTLQVLFSEVKKENKDLKIDNL